MNAISTTATAVISETVRPQVETPPPPIPAPLPQVPAPFAKWLRDDSSVYSFAESVVQRHLIAAINALISRFGSDWMQTRRLWSHDLARELCNGLSKDGCLFSHLYEKIDDSSYPVVARSLKIDDIAELGFDTSGLTHENMAQFAAEMQWYSIQYAAEHIFHLPTLVSHEQLERFGLDCSAMSPEELLRFSAAVYQELAGFDPKIFRQDFEAIVRLVAEQKDLWQLDQVHNVVAQSISDCGAIEEGEAKSWDQLSS